ncbi:MAG: hypothetical protein KDD13_03620 [Mangrovimonas sp.]|nr:hypothetical protein [Mangrovimonas sp.]MCB0426189.1 hypothetical protein [Mangrovimonas sp.]MCB0436363.1 hypothetical protein [Mangrovimonas sp.]
MKKLIFLAVLMPVFCLQAQTKSDLTKHYEAYYAQMKKQGDIQGIIDAMTHLNVLQPLPARLDTLAYVYMSDGRYLQALNTIGIDPNPSDSDIALEVKAVSLKSLGEPERAIPHFNEMFKRKPNTQIAYELADLNLQLGKLEEAKKHINYGMANVNDTTMKAYYESNQPYQVPLKAGFYYLKGILVFNENKTENIDTAVGFFDQAMQIAPNFNLAKISKEALLSQKNNGAQPKN